MIRGSETVLSRDHAFLWISALLFIASAAGTIWWCGSMSGGMPMPGGWIMSMAWMRMPGQTWPGAAACFLGMWVVMMLAMMMPSLVVMLTRYRRSLSLSGENRLGGLTALAGAGYFFVWTIFGLAAYPLGVVMAAVEMRWPALARSVPAATGVVLLIAGCIQFTAWKSRQLRCCLEAPDWTRSPAKDYRNAWRHGIRLGVHCTLCCSSFMMVLLVSGVMDIGVMAILAAAITLERLIPKSKFAAYASGAVISVAGMLIIARALGA